jgi:hypothetical protein
MREAKPSVQNMHLDILNKAPGERNTPVERGFNRPLVWLNPAHFNRALAAF